MARIGFLTHNTRQDNGWGRTSRELVEALRQQGIAVRVFVEEGGGIPGETRALGKSQIHPVFLFLSIFRVLPRLYACDSIHAFDGYPYAIIGALANMFLRKKFVVTLHGTYALDPFYSHRWYVQTLYRWALRQAYMVVGVSRYTLRVVREFTELPHAMVIPNGTGGFWLSAPAPKTKPAVRSPYLLSVGMIKPQKGFTVSLRAYATVKKQHPSLSYVLVGNQQGRYFEEIKKLVQDLATAESVYFFENVSDEELLALYDHAEFFVLTPIRRQMYIEGFGLVYREAGARGLAVIGSSESGAEDAVQDGVTGILCPQGDVEAVRRAMEKLLGDKALRARMGSKGRELTQRDTWERAAQQYQKLYEGCK